MELVVVVSIVTLLATLLAPSIQKAKFTAMKSRDLANLRQIAVGVLAYNAEKNILPGPVNRGIIVPNKATDRNNWLSTILVDQNYIPQSKNGDGIWKSPINYGSRTTVVSYVLNSTTSTIPENFFGDIEDQKLPKSALTLQSNNKSDPAQANQPLGQIWMVSNADGDNYGTANGVGDKYAIDKSILTPWGGRNYVFFDGHAEFRKKGDYPSKN